MTYEAIQRLALWTLMHLPDTLFWWGNHFLLIARAIANRTGL